MTHTKAYFASLLLFAIASALLYIGRAAIGTSTPLLLIVVGGYGLALTIAFPAQMARARRECAEWLRSYRATRPSPPPDGTL